MKRLLFAMLVCACGREAHQTIDAPPAATQIVTSSPTESSPPRGWFMTLLTLSFSVLAASPGMDRSMNSLTSRIAVSLAL